MLRKVIILLLLVVLFKGIVWSLFIPLWQFPDEQAHFAHVAFNVEDDHLLINKTKSYTNLTKEIYISEVALRTERDGAGNNKFTYHPKFRIPCLSGFDGDKENEIKNLSLESRRETVKYEDAAYPDFFYDLSGLIYRLFYPTDLFVRVFLIRLFWILLYVGIVLFSFKIALRIFKSSFLALISAILVSFQPMLTFVASGITSDNLHNFLYTLVIYFCLKLLDEGYNFKDLSLLAVITGLGLKTKPQFLISFSIIIPVILFMIFKQISKKRIKPLMGSIFLFFILLYLFGGNLQLRLYLENIDRGVWFPFFDIGKNVPNYSFWAHLKWSIRHTVYEVLPWYWGVFRWLSFVLPRWVNRVFMRILAVAGLGLLIKFFQILKRKEFNKKNLLFIFIFYVNLSYFLALLLWDWKFFQAHNFSFGIQGRYYFPAIVSQMILLVAGIQSFLNFVSKKILKGGLLILALWFVFVNSYAFYLVAGSYYNENKISDLIRCASQYKPWFAKGNWLLISLTVYLITMIFFIYYLLKLRLSLKHED